jgi:hypothetical protein
MAWSMKQAIRASIRLGVRAPKYGYRHVIFSPPQDESYSTKDLQKLIKAFNKECKVSRIEGGCLVFHPWRGKDISGYYPGQHWHALVDARIEKSEIKAFYRNHKWIVKDKGKRATTLGTLYYELRHAGYSRRKHTITWFGCYGYHAKLPKPNYHQPRVCDSCLHELEEIELDFEPMKPYTHCSWLTEKQLANRNWRFVRWKTKEQISL